MGSTTFLKGYALPSITKVLEAFHAEVIRTEDDQYTLWDLSTDAIRLQREGRSAMIYHFRAVIENSNVIAVDTVNAAGDKDIEFFGPIEVVAKFLCESEQESLDYEKAWQWLQQNMDVCSSSRFDMCSVVPIVGVPHSCHD